MHINGLNIFRFFAAVIVVIFHFGKEHTASIALKSGSEMVTFFVVLSGFVLALGYTGREMKLKYYAVNRAARILPLYWLSVLLSLAFPLGEMSVTGALLNFFLLQSLVPGYVTSVNPLGWAMSVLVIFYVLFPLLLPVTKRAKPGLLLAMALLLWLAVQVLVIWLLRNGYYKGWASTLHDLIYYSPMAHLCSFLLGIAGGCWLMAYKEKRLTGVLSLPLTVAVLTLVWAALEYKLRIAQAVGYELPFASSFFAPLFLLMIMTLAMAETPLTKMLSWRGFALLGEISFGMYLLQSPLLAACLHFAHAPAALGEFLAFLLLLVVLAGLVLWFVEKPTAKWIKLRFSNG